MPGPLPLVLLVLLCLAMPGHFGARVPCLEGTRGKTAEELKNDDWACTKFCAGPSSGWNRQCKLCCPAWLGGEGLNKPEPSGGGTDTNPNATKGTTKADDTTTETKESTEESTGASSIVEGSSTTTAE